MRSDTKNLIFLLVEIILKGVGEALQIHRENKVPDPINDYRVATPPDWQNSPMPPGYNYGTPPAQ